MHLFDQKIILNSFRTTLKSKFSWIWFGIMTPVILAIFLGFAIGGQGKVTYLGYQIFAISLSVLITLLVWEIVNLNFLFSSSRELGIMNLEIRKGRTSKEIFFSRLLVNKIFSCSFILLMMIFFLIIYAIFDSRDLTLFWLFLTFIPTDILFTAFFIFIVSFGRYKLGIAFASILLTLIALTPFLQILGSVFLAGVKNPSEYEMVSNYSANRVLSLAYADQEKEANDKLSFTHQLLEENDRFNLIFSLDQFDDELGQPNDDNNQNQAIREKLDVAGKSLVFEGLFYNGADIINEMWKYLPEFLEFKDYDITPLQITEDTEDVKGITSSLLYGINDKIAGEVKKGSLVNEYHESLYADHQVTNDHYQSMMKKLKTLTEKINLGFGGEYYQVKEFNQIVLDYAQGMLFNPDYSRLGWIETPIWNNGANTNGFYFPCQEYLERMVVNRSARSDQSAHLYGLAYQGEYNNNHNNPETLFKILQVAPELRLWNEIVVQLIENALSLSIKEMKEYVGDNSTKLVPIIPWSAQYEAWIFANPNLNFYDFYRLQSGKFMTFIPWYWSWKDSRYYNYTPENDVDKYNRSTFTKLTHIEKTNLADQESEMNFKSFSIVGYELTIAGIGIALFGFAFLVFFKKIKK